MIVARSRSAKRVAVEEHDFQASHDWSAYHYLGLMRAFRSGSCLRPSASGFRMRTMPDLSYPQIVVGDDSVFLKSNYGQRQIA